MQTMTSFFRRAERYERHAVDKKFMNADCVLFREEAFKQVVDREAARSSRSGRPVLLVLFDVSVWGSAVMTQKITSVLSSSTRETDVRGWYTDGTVLGILFTEFGKMHDHVDVAGEAIVDRLHGSLCGVLGNEEMVRLKLMPYVLPRETVTLKSHTVGNPHNSMAR